jgi:hypothetical protein
VNNNERIRAIDELPKLTDYVQETCIRALSGAGSADSGRKLFRKAPNKNANE